MKTTYLFLVLYNVQVPFIFKNLVDTLSETSKATIATAEAAATTGGLSGPALEAASAVPFAMVLGYGIARTTASGAQEVSASCLSLPSSPPVGPCAVLSCRVSCCRVVFSVVLARLGFSCCVFLSCLSVGVGVRTGVVGGGVGVLVMMV